MRKSFGVYIEEETLREFCQRFASAEDLRSRTIAKAIERALEVFCDERLICSPTLERLICLWEYRKAKGKTQAPDIDTFLNEILDYLKEDIFYVTPKDL